MNTLQRYRVMRQTLLRITAELLEESFDTRMLAQISVDLLRLTRALELSLDAARERSGRSSASFGPPCVTQSEMDAYQRLITSLSLPPRPPETGA